MTLFNIEKSNEEKAIQQHKILSLEKDLAFQNLKHNDTSIDNTALALLAQKERYTIRHESILKLLQERYKAKLNSLSEVDQSQIDDLSSQLKSMSAELALAKKCLLSSNTRKPVFSTGRYGGIT